MGDSQVITLTQHCFRLDVAVMVTSVAVLLYRKRYKSTARHAAMRSHQPSLREAAAILARSPRSNPMSGSGNYVGQKPREHPFQTCGDGGPPPQTHAYTRVRVSAGGEM